MKLATRATALILLLTLAQACTVEVKESDIILSDEEMRRIGEEQIAEIRQMGEGVEIEQIEVLRSDAVEARGLWLSQPGSETVLVYFGGNSMRIAEHYRVLEHLLAFGTDLVWLDHRGLGASAGEPELRALRRDGLETFDYVAGRTDKPMVLYGFSLGSFIAGHVAVRRPVAGLILEASATSAEEWMKALTPWYAKPFVRVDIEPSLAGAGNDRIVRRYEGDLFILVGEDDRTTPVELSRALYEASESINKRLHVASGRKHGNAITESAAKAEIRSFLQAL